VDNRVSAALHAAPVKVGGKDGAWGMIEEQRVLQLLFAQHSRKNLKFASGLVSITDLPCLLALDNPLDINGSTSISLSFKRVNLEVATSMPIAPLLSSLLSEISANRRKCYLFRLGPEHVVEEELSGEHGSVDSIGLEPFSRSKIWAFMPNASMCGKHIPMGSSHEEETSTFLAAGDSNLDGYLFTQFVSDDDKLHAVSLINAFNQRNRNAYAASQPDVHIMRVHNADAEKDRVHDKECVLM